MKNKPRLLGVDLGRALSAYAVVVVHSGDETWKVPVTQGAIVLRFFFYFAVPFFLAASFYFLTAKPEIDTSWRFWRAKIDRILVPYILWSLIYVVFRSIFFIHSHQPEQLQKFLYDPLSIVFFGGASYQLYFLPLLFSGTVLVFLAKFLKQKQVGIKVLIPLAIVSLVAYELLLDSHNGFQLNPNMAFQSFLTSHSLTSDQQPWMRFILVQIAWLLKCAPYLFIGMIFTPVVSNSQTWNSRNRLVSIGLATGLFLVGNSLLGRSILPEALQEVSVAYSLLFLGILLSEYIINNATICSLGVCSLGIYLIHPFAMNFVKAVLSKAFSGLLAEVSVVSMLTLSIATFLLSWLIVSGMSRNKWLAKYMLGI